MATTTDETKIALERPRVKKIGSGLVDKIFKGSNKRKKKRSLLRDESDLLQQQQSVMTKNHYSQTWTYRGWHNDDDARESSSLSYLVSDENLPSSDGYQAGSSDCHSQNVDTHRCGPVKTESTQSCQSLSRLQRQRNFRLLHIDTLQEESKEEQEPHDILFCRGDSFGCEQPIQRGPQPSASFFNESDTETSSVGSYFASEELSVTSELSGSDDEVFISDDEDEETTLPQSFSNDEEDENETPNKEAAPVPSKSTRVLLKNQYYKQKLANSPAMMRDRLRSSSSDCNLASYLEVSMRVF